MTERKKYKKLREAGRMLVERLWGEEVPSVDIVFCKECKWRGTVGCALSIVDDSDKPKDDDYCSFGERKCKEDCTER